MATKKQTTAKEQPVVGTPTYVQDPLLEFKVKDVTIGSDSISDVTEQSDITIRLQKIENQMAHINDHLTMVALSLMDIRGTLHQHFGIQTPNREIRG